MALVSPPSACERSDAPKVLALPGMKTTRTVQVPAGSNSNRPAGQVPPGATAKAPDGAIEISVLCSVLNPVLTRVATKGTLVVDTATGPKSRPASGIMCSPGV